MTPGPFRTGGGTRIRRPSIAITVIGFLMARLHGFARDMRGSAGVELAIGAFVLISVSALCFDLYSRVEAGTTVARMAVSMADYVSRDVDPDGDEMKALGEYLHEHELRVPANLVYVVTALHQPAGDPRPDVAVLWSDDTIRIGDSTATGDLAAECARYVADLPDDFAAVFPMADDEVLIIAEVCAGLTREGFLTGEFIAGSIYRLHALPARDPDRQPAAPVHTVGVQTYRAVAGVTNRGFGAGMVSGPKAPSPDTSASA